MSMGLGKSYFVHLITYCYGSLEECIQFMKKHEPTDDLHWFELKPIVSVKKDEPVRIKEYQCMLLEDSK